MFRSVGFPGSGLRAVALAALIGGQTACVRPVPVIAAARGSDFAASTTVAASFSVRTAAAANTEAPRIVVRDYWNAFTTSVVAWNDDEEYQGLRTSILPDGTVAYDHQLYFNAYPNPRAFARSNWYAFSDTSSLGRKLLFQGITHDDFNCVGRKGCSPLLTFRARVSDEMLRSSHDSLVVKVLGVAGYEEVLTIPGTLISSYLATVDSLSALRKARMKASN